MLICSEGRVCHCFSQYFGLQNAFDYACLILMKVMIEIIQAKRNLERFPALDAPKNAEL